MTKRKIHIDLESRAIQSVLEMAEQSLDPENFEKLENALSALKETRGIAALQRNDVPKGWNTNMDEAPRDKDVLLLVEPSRGHRVQVQGYYEEDMEWYECRAFKMVHPVAWMPLPSAPKPTGE